MISHIEANELLDQYALLLSQRQREVLELYFQDDLSLSEIQENLSVSKAAVHDALHKGIAALESFEDKLHLVRKQRALAAWMEEHPQQADSLAKAIEKANPIE